MPLYVTQAWACVLAVSAKPVPVTWVLTPFSLKGARAPEEMAVSRTGGRKVQNELRIYVNTCAHTPESKKMPTNDGAVLKGHSIQLEGDLTGQTGDNLSIKTNDNKGLGPIE